MNALREFIDIISTATAKDADGFQSQADTVVLSTRAAVETKNRTKKWANLAAYTTANALFRIRKHPDVSVTAEMRVGVKKHGSQYRIISVEDVAQRGMYIEIIAEKIEGSKW